MVRVAYLALLWLILPFLPLRLWWRGRREPAYRRAIGERFGFYRGEAAEPLIWIHAVSLGETRAAQPLVRLLAQRLPGHSILLTHMTATGRGAASELFPDASIAYLPYDYPFAVRRFIAHFRPRLAILMETEVWPNLLRGCARAGIPVLLANARLSERSARGYARVARFARETFADLNAVGAQTEADAERLRALGARAVTVTGNLKFDAASPPGAPVTAKALRDLFGRRPVFLAASTREGEEALLLEALGRRPLAQALVAIVPRHPQRFDEVARLIASREGALVRRSEGRSVPAECRYFLGDSLGEMPAYYRACDLAFIGGSLLPFGAQNLIEACEAGAPVLIGPSSFNFADAAAGAIDAGAAVRVADADALVAEATRLLAEPGERARMSERGRAFCAAHRGATERTLAICERLLAEGRDRVSG